MYYLIYYNILHLLGPAVPVAIYNLTATRGPSVDSALISWTVTELAYTPETYIVQYGESKDNLNKDTDPIHSEGQSASMNSSYSVLITDLEPGQQYFYQIVSRNTHGVERTDIRNMTAGHYYMYHAL